MQKKMICRTQKVWACQVEYPSSGGSCISHLRLSGPPFLDIWIMLCNASHEQTHALKVCFFVVNIDSYHSEEHITADHVENYLPIDRVHEKKYLVYLCFAHTACSIDRDWTTCQHIWYPHIRFSAIPCHLHLSGRSRDLFYWIRSKSPRHNGEVVWLFRSKAQNLQNPLLFLNNGKNAMMTSESLMGG